ncbi:class I SAM-dependent methyltransferase [Streptomyces sp. WI04-05B]|uniref:class I SAM-dependent methyltransferase n=1 Tax=Streptomyces TaxID=1883 RepID=UPI0029A220AB|nr:MULTISPECIES: class I SAM-dependent methyltransferase [unclassified Streptomyces]MDX2542335.1 class I SAM-dependent methyltransferase [Streptomyces sp. WI04-05B]MDX2584167.1 class I SAM-dependent methyltransferase [Streptomyces sp. WI04-05A]
MTSPGVAPEIVTFYAETIDEADRLSTTADGRLELVRTQELLRRHLPPPPARILDVGGGPGAHARWLVADGYDVHLVDPIPRHLTQAERIGATVELGDACHLTAEDASYDVVLLLGPLYHLPDRTDRDRALAEAHRVLKPGGLLAAAGINRYASLFEHTAFAHLHKEPLRGSISGILATQVHDGKKAFTKAYFHTGAQLLDEVSTANFSNTQVYGIEGPAWSLLAATERHTGESLGESPLFESALAAARMAEPYPELLSASSHLLAVGNRPG